MTVKVPLNPGTSCLVLRLIGPLLELGVLYSLLILQIEIFVLYRFRSFYPFLPPWQDLHPELESWSSRVLKDLFLWSKDLILIRSYCTVPKAVWENAVSGDTTSVLTTETSVSLILISLCTRDFSNLSSLYLLRAGGTWGKNWEINSSVGIFIERFINWWLVNMESRRHSYKRESNDE